MPRARAHLRLGAVRPRNRRNRSGRDLAAFQNGARGATSGEDFALPDKISIYRGPIERYCGHDHKLLEQEVWHVVLHELAHHFGISDERLIEIGRY
jgi:predicted Zn-dependent protease with MMP-like domain